MLHGWRRCPDRSCYIATPRLLVAATGTGKSPTPLTARHTSIAFQLHGVSTCRPRQIDPQSRRRRTLSRRPLRSSGHLARLTAKQRVNSIRVPDTMSCTGAPAPTGPSSITPARGRFHSSQQLCLPDQQAGLSSRGAYCEDRLSLPTLCTFSRGEQARTSIQCFVVGKEAENQPNTPYL